MLLQKEKWWHSFQLLLYKLEFPLLSIISFFVFSPQSRKLVLYDSWSSSLLEKCIIFNKQEHPLSFFSQAFRCMPVWNPEDKRWFPCVYCVHILKEFPLLQTFYKSLIPPNFLCLIPIECNPGLERVQMLPLRSLNLSG